METRLQPRPAEAPAPAHVSPGAVRTRAAVAWRAHVPLVLIMAGGFVLSAIWTLRVTDWGIMPDELLYAKLSLSLGLPSVRGEYYAQFTPLYPLAISPSFLLFDVPFGLRVAHLINALLMVSTALPTYLLARAIDLPRAIAYCPAALSVVVPWMVFMNFLTTEALAYPVFVWAVLGIVRAAQRATPGRDLVALALVAVAALTRTQFIVLAAVLPAAVALHEVGYGLANRGGRSYRSVVMTTVRRAVAGHWVLACATALGVVVLIGFAVTGGVGQVLGAYSGTLSGELFPHGTSRDVRGHVALLGLGIAFIPFMLALAFGIAVVLRPASRAEHAFAVALGLAVPALLLEATSVNIRTIGLVQERYVFFVAPLLFVATTAYLLRPRLVPATLGASLVLTAWFGAKLDYALDHSFSLAWPFHRWLTARTDELGDLPVLGATTPGDLLPIALVLGAVAVFFALRLVPGRAVVFGTTLFLLAYCGVQMTYNFSNVTIKTDPEARVSKTSDIAADWVDQALPSGAKVAAVPGVLDNFGRTRVIWWDVEFWNKSVDRVYDYEPAWLDTPYATQRLRLNWRTGALAVDRPAEYLVVPRYDRRFRPAGRPLARTDALELIEAKQPLSAAWAIRGTDSDGWTGPRAPAYIHLFASGAGEATRMRATVELTSASTIRQRFAIEGGERRVRGRAARKGRRHVVVPVCVDPTSGARLVLRVRDVIQLPSGKPAGLAITRVRTAPAGRCGSRA